MSTSGGDRGNQNPYELLKFDAIENLQYSINAFNSYWYF